MSAVGEKTLAHSRNNVTDLNLKWRAKTRVRGSEDLGTGEKEITTDGGKGELHVLMERSKK